MDTDKEAMIISSLTEKEAVDIINDMATKTKVIAIHAIAAIDKLKFLKTLLKASLNDLKNILSIFIDFITSFRSITYFNTVFNSDNSFFHTINNIFIMCSHNNCSS